MKRKIPLFTLYAPDGIDYSNLSKTPEVKKVIIDETLYAIKEGVKKNKKNIPLFEVANSNCYIELEKENWKPTLKNVLDYYIEVEEYDKCIECRDLINKL